MSKSSVWLKTNWHKDRFCLILESYHLDLARPWVWRLGHIISYNMNNVNCTRRVYAIQWYTTFISNFNPTHAGNNNNGKGNGAGLARESQSHCFADEFGITHAHSFVQTYNMTTVKAIAEQYRQLLLNLNNEQFFVNFNHIIFFVWKFGI